MGGSLGCHRSIPKDPTDLGCASRKFSAACNFGHILVNQERLNINAATEEELMTLPGVNRGVARNIVDYRERIGGFRKVEDLALVSGVGAAKLEAVKLEICVSSRGGSSQHSPSSLRKDAEQQQLQQQQQQQQPPPPPCCAGVNINSATPAQLVSIRGITDKMAQNVVAFRAEHGAFRSIEDLVRVPSINGSLLDKIRFQVYVERSRAPSTNATTRSSSSSSSKSQPSPTAFSLGSDDLDLPPGGPAHILSARPSVEPPVGLREGRAVVRLATWSLQGCSSDKANNPGVKEVVCMTLLENHIKLLAVQDLLDPDALDKFCVELNQATLSSVRRWKWPRGLWKSIVSERPSGRSSKGATFSGFLWDTSSGVELRDAALLEPPAGNGSDSSPPLYRARFTLGSHDLTVVNVHMTASSDGQEVKKVPQWSSSLQDNLKGDKELLLLGDFGCSAHSSQLDLLRKEKLWPLVPPTQFTNISTRQPQGTRCLDNIWLSRSLKKIYAGHYMVVREGLTNPWIPDNWSWGGVASDHCPLLAEFFIDACSKELSRPGVTTVDRGDFMSKHER